MAPERMKVRYQEKRGVKGSINGGDIIFQENCRKNKMKGDNLAPDITKIQWSCCEHRLKGGGGDLKTGDKLHRL